MAPRVLSIRRRRPCMTKTQGMMLDKNSPYIQKIESLLGEAG